jgi:hypothetical protein
MSNDSHEATPQELLEAENLQKDYIAHRQSRGRFKKLLAPWDNPDAWVKAVRKAHLRGVKGSDIMPMLICANRDQTVLTADIHRLMAGGGFEMVVRKKDLMPGEADEMREVCLDPNNPDDVDKFHIMEWFDAALRSIGNAAGTHDTKSNAFVENLAHDITGTDPFLRYLIGWRHPEVDQECGEDARKFFREKMHLAKACIALGWPKEIIAPDFEI